MDLFNKLKNKVQTKTFLSKKPEPEKIKLILEAAHNAPTTSDTCPQRILIIDNIYSFNNLNSCVLNMTYAPLALVICYDKNESWKRPSDGKDFGLKDIHDVAAHMMVTAYNLGLSANTSRDFDPIQVNKTFMMPEHVIPVFIMHLGYPVLPPEDVLVCSEVSALGSWSTGKERKYFM